MSDERTDPPLEADERASLSAFLDYHRDTLALKCAGLSDEQLRTRAVPPSPMSLLGLVRHLTEVERGWLGNRVAHRDLPPLYCFPDNPDGDFDDVDTADVAEAFATWRAACAESRDIVAGVDSLDFLGKRGNGDDVSLRWIMLHLFEEYARHNGHADLLRERLDGATGE
ncbi:DinB family protein [Umezawaea sp. Da 62-37]|uniref:DinB family protein n=1 Tax=Umezawaea sp. Da 62-37 TaxID=3075927 RepID=UPI0028F70D52|nr:DinB family protein [Umezawaea sp. Da 62-37]WNV83742.1 DinB family protein [Umezawaea sp. Da 62-37]